MLRRAHFQNIKALRDVDVDLSRFTVLVGPNGCGKSTVLDHSELVCLASQPWLKNPLGMAGKDSLMDAIGPDSLRGPDSDGPIVWQGMNAEGNAFTMEIAAPNTTPWRDRTSFRAIVDGRVVDANDGQAFRELREMKFNWRAHRLRLVPSEVAKPSPVESNFLRPDGFGLATLLKDLAADDRVAYARLMEDMKSVVPQFEDLKFGKGNENGKPTHTLFLEMLGAGRVPADRVSEGTLLALAFLSVAHQRDTAELILIDDIDHGLHLTAQYQVIQAIRRVMEVRPELQVVCTTHSPYLLDAFQPDEVRVMALDSKGHTRIRALVEHPDFEKWHSMLQTGEFWASVGEDWVSRASAHD